MDPFSLSLHQTGNHMLLPGLDGRLKLGGGVNEASPSCPRCASPNTKFCYYNNYSLTQPRYFCKSCRRYWTKGGSLRNVPVGGGCRKNRRSRAARANPCSGNSKNSNNSASVSSDDLDEHDRVSGNSSGPSDIDMAAVFARFLNKNPGSDASESDQFHFNVEGDSPSNDIEFDPMFAQPPNDIGPMMFLPQQSNGAENNPVYSEETAEDFVDGNDLDILGLLPSVLDDGDLSRPPMPDDGLWIGTESSPFPNSTWQLHETFP